MEGWRKKEKEACEREGKGGMKEARERWRNGGRKRKKEACERERKGGMKEARERWRKKEKEGSL